MNWDVERKTEGLDAYSILEQEASSEHLELNKSILYTDEILLRILRSIFQVGLGPQKSPHAEARRRIHFFSQKIERTNSVIHGVFGET